MIERSAFATFASATAFALILNQFLAPGPARAEDRPQNRSEIQSTDGPAQSSPADAARIQAAERRAAADAQRRQRYEDLRSRAAEVGIELPETPPWEDNDARMSERGRSAAERERRQAEREARWHQMQQEASERGVPMPDASPWEEASKHRQAMAERYEAYRKTIEAMTDEQREAAQAMFGGRSDQNRVPRAYPAYPPRRHYGIPYWEAPCHDDGTGYPSSAYQYPGPSYDQGPPPPPVRSGH
ncbi:hypothetical protein [Imhoffiella purpurea]|uniref:Uncharacterized protein n=1 Tax=Imhoffiella purpurea TaxID=1249627 RepID=W9V9X4_9GAMM|nr:hypothetical protein [Imhoffiella purpurea]EXJ16393.1 hypothetical protein D779_0327 [Imhoffiella purpurea]